MRFEKHWIEISKKEEIVSVKIRHLSPTPPGLNIVSSILQPYDMKTGLWNFTNEYEFLQGVLLDDSRYFFLLTMRDKVSRIYEALFNNNNLPNLEPAVKTHIRWGIASYNNNFIIVIGSFMVSKSEYSWELYNISQNWWKTLPNLNHLRIGHSVIVINDFVYWIGGKSLISKAEFCSSFERLNLSLIATSENFTSERWENITPWTAPESYKIKWYWSGVSKVDDNEIIIFGGMSLVYDPKKKAKSVYIPGTRRSYLYNITQNEIKVGDSNQDLHQRDLFCDNQAVSFNSKIYCFGNILNDLHIFDINKKIWSILSKESYSSKVTL